MWDCRAFEELKDGHPRLAVRSETTPIDQLAFEGGEETLAHRIVVGVADRACRWTNAGLLAAIAESDRGVLGTAIRIMDDVGWLSGHERHVESVEHDAGLQIGREGPSDDPARPRVENDREVEKSGQLGRKVMSATHNAFGRSAAKLRRTRSLAR